MEHSLIRFGQAHKTGDLSARVRLRLVCLFYILFMYTILHTYTRLIVSSTSVFGMVGLVSM